MTWAPWIESRPLTLLAPPPPLPGNLFRSFLPPIPLISGKGAAFCHERLGDEEPPQKQEENRETEIDIYTEKERARGGAKRAKGRRIRSGREDHATVGRSAT